MPMRSLLSLALFALLVPAHGADLYSIEVIAFSRQANPDDNELWTRQRILPAFDTAIEPEDALNPGPAFDPEAPSLPLPASAPPPLVLPALGDTLERLAANSAYRVLYHNLWLQLAPVRSESRPVHLRGVGRLTPDPEFETPGDIAGNFEGTLRFFRGRYLQLEINARFTPPFSMDTFAPVQPLVLRQRRRIRARELHYFDHPHFGILVRVEKLAAPWPPEPEPEPVPGPEPQITPAPPVAPQP